MTKSIILISLSLFAISSTCILSCEKKTTIKNSIEYVQYDELGNCIKKTVIEGHEYLLRNSDGIIHSESCKNESHKQ